MARVVVVDRCLGDDRSFSVWFEREIDSEKKQGKRSRTGEREKER